MNAYVYMSNSIVRVVCGRKTGNGAKIAAMHCIELPEGCLINGLITNADALADTLRKSWKKLKLPRKVSLVVESTQIKSKKVRFPKLNGKNTEKILAHEFSDAMQLEKPLYDYRVLNYDKDTKNVYALATATETAFVAAYGDLFERAGIKLLSIGTALSSALDFIALLPEQQGKSTILLYLDQNICSSYLVANGAYIYSNATRVFSAPGTPEFVTEIFRCVSGIVQFHASEKLEYPINAAYYCGFPPETFSALSESAHANLDVNAKTVPALAALRLPKKKLKNKTVLNTPPSAAGDFMYPIGDLVGRGGKQ